MFYTDHATIKTDTVKEFEASQDLLAFMAFNLKEPVSINRFYFEGSENKTLIVVHFSFREFDWLLQRNVGNDTWAIKKKEKGVMLFTFYTKDDIICGKF